MCHPQRSRQEASSARAQDLKRMGTVAPSTSIDKAESGNERSMTCTCNVSAYGTHFVLPEGRRPCTHSTTRNTKGSESHRLDIEPNLPLSAFRGSDATSATSGKGTSWTKLSFFAFEFEVAPSWVTFSFLLLSDLTCLVSGFFVWTNFLNEKGFSLSLSCSPSAILKQLRWSDIIVDSKYPMSKRRGGEGDVNTEGGEGGKNEKNKEKKAACICC